MISIILGLSLTQALVGTANLARESKLVVGFTPYTLWIAGLILAHFLSWWAVWDYRDVDWTFPRFLTVLIAPLLLFFLSSVVFPGRPGGSALNLEQYFFQIRKWLMAGYALLSAVWIVDGPLVLEIEPTLHVYRIPQTIGVIAPLWGLRSSNPRTHLVIASVVLAVLLSGTVIRFLPGAFWGSLLAESERSPESWTNNC